MKKFKFKKIDAFATLKSEGNPAGCIWLDSKSDITKIEMQQVAKELKGFVNEGGYIFQIAENEYDLKYYSSEREVDFCGHATIGIMYDLINNNPTLQQLELLHIKTNHGKLTVQNRIKEEGAVFILSPEPIEHKKLPKTIDIADKLRIKTEELDKSLPVCIINAGLTTLLVPIKTLKSILHISPDFEELKAFCVQSGIDIIEVFTSNTANQSSNFRTRVFAPSFGYLEDPATGSGNSAFGYYILKNDMWEGNTITIEQNGSKNQFNIIKLQKQKDDKRNERILFGGGAITRIEGDYIVQ